LRNKIILTGGGSAGHVTPNIALIPKLKEKEYDIYYMGSIDGIERKLIEDEFIDYYPISSGKLRRYFDLRNLLDPFKVMKGVFQSWRIIKKTKPAIVFSKGGFVSVPVVLGAYLNRIPIIIHESDLTPGLANKLAMPFAKKVCVTFPESLKHIKPQKAVLTGSPIREAILKGDRLKGLHICSFSENKKVILIIGGSLGSRVINETIRNNLGDLLKKYHIIHICGKGNLDDDLNDLNGYKQFEFVRDELPHLIEASDLVISRAGANVIFELVALKKPNILIPLSSKSSRGDQILNAASFEKSGYSMVIQEEELKIINLLTKIEELDQNSAKYIINMEKSNQFNSVDKIIELIELNKRK